ncbi:GNAT family N-acetyltransferase [Thalassotalea sediminis]|uniref:GNAT family N-acetyltransferase n=1 Tax=Thalassotalea sediminis TaxID=1759089 RepID=UPI002574651F|nr:GNAT family N-acetyltransferase [Thalassotalea sediminis]
MNNIHCSIIDNLTDLETLKTSWENLRRESKQSSICLSVDWMIVWCLHYLTPKDKIHILLFRHNQKLIAICPFYIKKGVLTRELRFIGTGEPEEAEVASEFQDIIVLPSFEEAILKKLTVFMKESKLFSKVCFDVVLKKSYIFNWLENYQPNNWYLSKINVGRRFILPIEENDTLQIQNFRSKTTRRHARKALHHELLQYQLVQNNHELQLAFQKLMQLHNKAWKKKGKKGAFESQKFTNFHKDYCQTILNENRLLIFTVNLKQEVLAVFYGIIDHDTLFYYQSGIQYNKNVASVGTAMHLFATQIARKEQLSHYDLMKGDTNSYKNNYQASEVACYTFSAHTYPVLNWLYKLHKVLRSGLLLFK